MAKIIETRISPESDINTLVRRLDCEQMPDCQMARQSLVDIGRPAVPALIELLKSPKQWVRWESAKALGQIGDKAAIPALIETLEDVESDVRWVSAEALIKSGKAAAIPLLQALIDHPKSFWTYEGAHHVLNHLARRDVHNIHHALEHPQKHTTDLSEQLTPVLEALEANQGSGVQVPVLARKAIEALKG